MNYADRKPHLALPLQARPVWRNEGPPPAAENTQYGVQAAMRCTEMTGMARQMCLAKQGVYV